MNIYLHTPKRTEPREYEFITTVDLPWVPEKDSLIVVNETAYNVRLLIYRPERIFAVVTIAPDETTNYISITGD